MTIAVSSGQVSNLERMGGIWQGRSFGNAVGPRWSASLPSGAAQRSIIVENDCEVKRLVCRIRTLSIWNSMPLLSTPLETQGWAMVLFYCCM
jgi:hypothetical protein